MAHGTMNPSLREMNPTQKDHNKGQESPAQDTLEKAKDVGAQVMDKAKEACTSVGEMAGQAASAVGKSADDLTSTAGSNVKQFAHTMGEKAPHEGMLGQASQAAAHTLEQAGKYVEDAKLSGMARDLTHIIERHPIPAILICFGIGVCVGRALRD